MLHTFVNQYPPGRVVFVFDTARSQYRTAIYSEYKKSKQRDNPKTREDKSVFAKQLPYIIDLCRNYGITVIAEETKGLEADDAIAYLCARAESGAFGPLQSTVVFSSDRDLCGLVKHRNTVWIDPVSNRIVTQKNFLKEFGVTVDQYRDYKVLIGDASDNIPHPNKVGEVTARKLLAEHKSIERMLALKVDKVYPYKEVIDLAIRLVTLDLHIRFPEDPWWTKIDECMTLKRQQDLPFIKEVFESLEFNSILETWEDDLPRLLSIV